MLFNKKAGLIGNNFLSNSEVKTIAAINIITHSFCGKNGHTNNVCFKKNGFPSNKNNSNKKTCTHYGRFRHTVDVCYKKHGYPPGHKMLNGKTKTVEIRDENTDQEVKFKPQQYQALMALIKQPNEATASTQVNQLSNM